MYSEEVAVQCDRLPDLVMITELIRREFYTLFSIFLFFQILMQWEDSQLVKMMQTREKIAVY